MIRNRGKERDGMELDERLRQENTSRTFQWSSRETHSLRQTGSMSCLHVSNTMLPSSDHRGKHAVFSKQVWSDVCLCERPTWIRHEQRDLLHRSTVMLSLTRIMTKLIFTFSVCSEVTGLKTPAKWMEVEDSVKHKVRMPNTETLTVGVRPYYIPGVSK